MYILQKTHNKSSLKKVLGELMHASITATNQTSHIRRPPSMKGPSQNPPGHQSTQLLSHKHTSGIWINRHIF